MKIRNKLMSLNANSKTFQIVIVNYVRILSSQTGSIKLRIKTFQQNTSVSLDSFKSCRYIIDFNNEFKKKFKHFEKADLDRYNEI